MIINYTGISDTRIAYPASELIKEKPGQAIIICSSQSRARRIADDLSFFSDVPVLVYPELELAAMRYDAKSPAELTARLKVLNKLQSGEPCIVVAPVLGALKQLTPPEIYSKNVLHLTLGGRIDRAELIKTLASLGYERVSSAEAGGQFAVRGDIIDLFSGDRDLPVRIELFDDEIDSLRCYDPMTQRSVEQLKSIRIRPAQLLVKDSDAFERAVKGISSAYNKATQGKKITQEALDKLREQRDYLISCIEEGLNFQYLEAYISYFYENTACLWDYMKDPSFVIVDDPSRIAETLDFYLEDDGENQKQMLERYQAVPKDFDSNPQPEDLYRLKELASGPNASRDGSEALFDLYFTTPFSQQIRYTDRLDQLSHIESMQAPVFSGHMDMLKTELKRYISKGYSVTICCGSDERIDNLKDFFYREGLEGRVALKLGSLSGGCEYPEDKVLFLAESDVFSNVKRTRKKGRRRGQEIKAFTDIKKGDYVVHENHGVGRFAGVEKLTVDGSTRDYLRIEYAASDVLYIPVDQMESVQKYVGSEGVEPKINRLSGSDWALTKAKAKAAIKDMAEDFLRLSAQRAAEPGYQFGPDSSWQKEFEDSFPYEETDDQLRCTEEIKKDMESDKAMDRLLCGDVGYGKTEVAARAIFKCLEEGKQAAVLVPTTILANQHYNTFLERFKAYPFQIEMLSRFRTDKQQGEIVEKLKKGEIDLIVGTHRLLSKDVKFKDLGLLVVDEEQRFGVEHKEAIKQLKHNVDVLTLSATPIPRTLHMSLIGIRDMSVIEEPPEDRYPVQTYVMEQDDAMMANIIRRELDRDGQVYFVYNRVRGIQTMARKIRDLVPEARVSVGHGQMSERELEDVMMNFVNHESNVLVATTIIESGLDIPNVNTIIIMDADRFGLSQLYQLRGRVGRSNRMAYAYLLYKKDKVLSEIAEKRLRAIREFTEFGAGFRVAMRDLELRGAGNILGIEQSGHMLSIGYGLYCRMVDEAVRELKGEALPKDNLNADSSVELAVAAFLPERYISDEITRLEMYKRISSIYSEDDRSEVTDELIDRFGDIPRETENLLDIAMIRNKASRCGVSKVMQQRSDVVLLFEEQNALDPEMLGRLVDSFGNRLSFFGGKEPKIRLQILGDTAVGTALSMLDVMTA
ncbi:MAG: transcription-repair coupling factor [Firmicutes bacterium]|nr:transcription-repair coupling factor [Bacillota bacterium]